MRAPSSSTVTKWAMRFLHLLEAGVGGALKSASTNSFARRSMHLVVSQLKLPRARSQRQGRSGTCRIPCAGSRTGKMHSTPMVLRLHAFVGALLRKIRLYTASHPTGYPGTLNAWWRS